MTHCIDHSLVKPTGQNGTLCDTLRPQCHQTDEEVWRGRKEGEAKRSLAVVVFVFGLIFVCLLALFCSLLRDASGVRERYGETRRWAKLGGMM